MIGCWRWYGRRWHNARPVTAELGGGVESNWSGLEDFVVRDISVCLVADLLREGRDLKSYGGGR